MIKNKKKAKIIVFIAFILLLCSLFYNFSFSFADENSVYLGGMPVGFSITTRGASVVGINDVKTKNGTYSPAKDAGVEIGDIILSINDVDINSAEDIEKVICDSELLKLKIKRENDYKIFYVLPKCDKSGKNKIGVFLRSNVSGVGTITYIKNNKFASLGHPISDEKGNMIEIVGGNIFSCNIVNVSKGEKGRAGELKGSFVNKNAIGKVANNKCCGVFGEVYENFNTNNLRKVEVLENSATIGKASIFTTVDGCTPKEYEINIVKVEKGKDRNFVIKITDDELIKKTGGIVQGMSGSPILQNGKLIGAVTHVFVNDPTRGFGIDVTNLINQ